MQIYADVLGRPSGGAESHAVALGRPFSAIRGRASEPDTAPSASHPRHGPPDNAITYRPNPNARPAYERLYGQYIQLMTRPFDAR